MDRLRTERNTVSTFRRWSVAADRCASFKQIDGQVKKQWTNFFYFAMMICCCWWISVLQGHLGTGQEPKEKIFLICNDDLFLQRDASPSRKLMDRSKTEGETVSTLGWWSFAGNRYQSFKVIDPQVKNWRRNCFYFAMMICCCWLMWVL